jgi:hypothetical protein
LTPYLWLLFPPTRQFPVIFRLGNRVAQGNQGPGEQIHSFGDGLRLDKLVGAQFFHSRKNRRLDFIRINYV